MAFPDIPTVAGGKVITGFDLNGSSTRTSPNISGLTRSNGDLLICIVNCYNSTTTNAQFSSFGPGWTEFGDFCASGTQPIGCGYRFSDGTETTVVASVSTVGDDSAFIMLAISGAHASTAPEAGGYASGTGAAADPTSLNPAGWDAEDTLWIAVAASGEDATTGSFTGIASGPTNYTNYADTGISADVVGGVEGAVAFRQLNAASEDAGVFSVDLSNARNAAMLIAVRPAPAGPAVLMPRHGFVNFNDPGVC